MRRRFKEKEFAKLLLSLTRTSSGKRLNIFWYDIEAMTFVPSTLKYIWISPAEGIIVWIINVIFVR